MAKLRVRPQQVNANKHTPYGLGLLETSIGRDGWIDAITVAADDESISGSARIETGAAKGWDFAHEEPLVIQAPDDRPLVVETTGRQPLINRRVDIPSADDPRARRLSVAANAITVADWVPDPQVLAGWAETDESIQSLFTDDSWSALLADVGQNDIGGAGDDFDATPPEGPTRTQVGDLWVIGGVHRLIVGDCTDPLVVERLMGGERADAVVTDPPYGVRYRQGDEKRRWHAAKKRFVDVPIHGDDQPFDPAHLIEAAPLVVLWGANNYADKLPPSRGWLVWDKKPDITSNDFADAELAWTNRDAVVRAFRHRWSGVIRDSQNGDEHYHATEKPIALFDWCFGVCGAGDLIYDPYLGSGTAIIAAHQTGRRCFGCEIAPKWADTCLRRAEAAGLTCERQ